MSKRMVPVGLTVKLPVMMMESTSSSSCSNTAGLDLRIGVMSTAPVGSPSHVDLKPPVIVRQRRLHGALVVPRGVKYFAAVAAVVVELET